MLVMRYLYGKIKTKLNMCNNEKDSIRKQTNQKKNKTEDEIEKKPYCMRESEVMQRIANVDINGYFRL